MAGDNEFTFKLEFDDGGRSQASHGAAPSGGAAPAAASGNVDKLATAALAAEGGPAALAAADMAGSSQIKVGPYAAIGAMVEGAATSWVRAVRTAETEMLKLARNDNFGVVADAAQLAADGLGKLSPAAGAVATALVETTKAIWNVSSAFVERGLQLSKYSGDLTGARIDAGIRSMEGDIHEAEVLGPKLAELIEAQSKTGEELRELLLPIKKWLIEFLTDLMKDIGAGVKEIRAFAHAIHVVFESARHNWDAYRQQGHQYTQAFIKHLIGEGAEAYRRAKAEEKAPKEGIAVQQLWGLANQVPGAGRVPDHGGKLGQMLDQLKIAGANRRDGGLDFDGAGGAY